MVGAVDATGILIVFLALRLVQHVAERTLARLNRRYYLDASRRAEAQRVLGITDDDMAKTLAYSEDKFRFATFAGWMSLAMTLAFLGLGGLGLVERGAMELTAAIGGNDLAVGLVFFGILGLLAYLANLPFNYYRTFVVEQRHGFNRQTVAGFWLDTAKAIALVTILGGLVLAAVLGIMSAAGTFWWFWAWIAMSAFSVLTAWLYPTFLAPLFNKFAPVTEGELKDKIDALASRIGFKAAGVFIMDASKRSSHGNAYFTGVGQKKRIVLFDTLVKDMAPGEVVAVLAHELGHFKLHHVRWALIRGVLMTGLTFYLLSLALPLTSFYEAFALRGVSNYGALVVFSLWFGLLDFLIQPFTNHLSRKNEFAADAFAREQLGSAGELATALLKLREQSHSMPLSHPAFSSVYHSHPPLLERLKVLRSP